MTPFLLKIYSFFAMIGLVITSSLFHKTATTTPEIRTEKIVTTEQTKQQEEKPNINPQTTEEKPVIKAIQNPTATFATTTILATTPKIAEATPENTELDYQTTGEQSNPCVSPIMYTLDTFDPRFNITQNHFLDIVHDATTLWEGALGTTLFEYDPIGKPSDLTINLVYDERQAQTDKNKLLATEIDNSRNAAKALADEYESLKVIFARIKDEYLSEVDTFNARQKKYNDTVSYWNTQGGAPKADYDALTLEKTELEKVAVTLTQKHDTLTAMLNDINTKITRHNELVSFANQKINENNSSAHKKFTEGNYNSGTHKITIYQFMDEIKLQRVITHELGHALGIGHTKNKQSIMYAINTATSTVLSSEDIEALKIACKRK